MKNKYPVHVPHLTFSILSLVWRVLDGICQLLICKLRECGLRISLSHCGVSLFPYYIILYYVIFAYPYLSLLPRLCRLVTESSSSLCCPFKAACAACLSSVIGIHLPRNQPVSILLLRLTPSPSCIRPSPKAKPC